MSKKKIAKLEAANKKLQVMRYNLKIENTSY